MLLEAVVAKKVPTARKSKLQVRLDDSDSMRSVAIGRRGDMKAVVMLESAVAFVAVQPSKRLDERVGGILGSIGAAIADVWLRHPTVDFMLRCLAADWPTSGGHFDWSVKLDSSMIGPRFVTPLENRSIPALQLSSSCRATHQVTIAKVST